jgi:hypothetical protein
VFLFKTLTSSKNCSESRIKFFSNFPLLSWPAGFWKNFPYHKRVSVHLGDLKCAKPFRESQAVTLKQAETLICILFTKKQKNWQKIVKTIRSIKKYCFEF